MPRRLNEQVVARDAVVNSGGAATGIPIVATKVNGTGFSRARFIFKMSNAATTASLSTGLGVWAAATSGATYALVASAAANTSGQLSGGENNIVVIDVPISSAAPWLQMSGSFVSATPAHSATVELYHGVNRPPTQAELQVVVA